MPGHKDFFNNLKIPPMLGKYKGYRQDGSYGYICRTCGCSVVDHDHYCSECGARIAETLTYCGKEFHICDGHACVKCDNRNCSLTCNPNHWRYLKEE